MTSHPGHTHFWQKTMEKWIPLLRQYTSTTNFPAMWLVMLHHACSTLTAGDQSGTIRRYSLEAKKLFKLLRNEPTTYSDGLRNFSSCGEDVHTSACIACPYHIIISFVKKICRTSCLYIFALSSLPQHISPMLRPLSHILQNSLPPCPLRKEQTYEVTLAV